MKTKQIVFFLLLFFAWLISISCGKKCAGNEIHFVLIYGNPGDSFKIFIDDSFRAGTKLKESRLSRVGNPADRFFTICTTKDSLKVRVLANLHDTTFYVRSKEIMECFVGINMPGQLNVFQITKKDGYGAFSPVR